MGQRSDGRSASSTLVELTVHSITGGPVRNAATGSVLVGTKALPVDGNGQWSVALAPQSDLYDPNRPQIGEFDVIDDGSGSQAAWPGDLAFMPNGKWLAVWENAVPPFNLTVWAAEADDPMGTWSTPVALSTTIAVDPWIVTLGGSDVFVGWQGGPDPSTPGFSWVKRTSLGVWSAPSLLFNEVGLGHSILEGTTNRIGSDSWMVYDRKPSSDPFLWDIAVRKIISDGGGGITVGSFTTVVASPYGPGMGALGDQTRATIVDSGDGGLLIVWAKDAGGGVVTSNPRSLYISRSDDAGVHWSEPRLIYTDPNGKDVVNPYLLLMPSGNVRCYAYRDGIDPMLMLESPDGGDSWPISALITEPVGVQPVRLIAKLNSGIVVGLANAFSQTQVGTWQIDPPGAPVNLLDDTWYQAVEHLPQPVTYRFRVPELGGPFSIASIAF